MKTTSDQVSAPNPSTPEATRPVAHISSVPDREFERPRTTDELRDLAYLGSEIILNAIHHVGFEQEQDDAWQVLRCAQLETSSAHAFICEAKFVGPTAAQNTGAQ